MPQPKWYKGNIHTHTTESDGDASPEKVVRWYRRHGYDFLVLSDHNHLTLLEYGRGKRRFKRPLMIPGEEVTIALEEGERAVHLNGIGISRMVEPIDATEVVPTLQANIYAILDAGGIASINHPNYTWAFDHEDISRVTGASLLEVFNGHPQSHVYGAPDKPSYEEIWDGVLSRGKVIFGAATDDAHNYSDFSPDLSNPGRGWVMVQVKELTEEAIIKGLASGNFYSSTGVELEDAELSQDRISVYIKQHGHSIYTTRFIGPNSTTHEEVVGAEATYHMRGDEGYVRAVITSSAGYKAWTQPVFLR